jgi:murein DD-endopeptidase MepM/ murein hydrolase activator NlpD
MRRLLVCLFACSTHLLLIASAPVPQLASSSARWFPEQPLQGSFIQLEVSLVAPDSTVNVQGELAGEPLHFMPAGPATLRALAGIPIDAKETVTVPLVIERAGSPAERLTIEIPVKPGKYSMEKLSVAPKFGKPPDPETAARIKAESERALEVSRRSHETKQLWHGAFVNPRPGRVTSGFGDGREFNGVIQSRHMGVDFPGAEGSPVRSPNRGVVALVDDFYLGGNVVYIDHGAGLVTGYLHLSRTDVATGDRVERGQIIGRVGATGRVTGPHLHWLARYGHVTLNPMTLLGVRS